MSCIDSNPIIRTGGTVLLIGSSAAGKSTLIRSLLSAGNNNSNIFEVRPSQIIIISHEQTENLAKDLNLDIPVEFRTEMFESDIQFPPYTCIIFNDLLTCSGKEFNKISEQIVPYFTRKANHEKLFIFLTSQQMYPYSAAFRTINSNATYLVLFKSHRNYSQIRYLSQQIFASAKPLVQIYEDALEQSKHPYLWMDFHPLTDKNFRFKTNIISDLKPDIPCIIYQSS